MHRDGFICGNRSPRLWLTVFTEVVGDEEKKKVDWHAEMSAAGKREPIDCWMQSSERNKNSLDAIDAARLQSNSQVKSSLPPFLHYRASAKRADADAKRRNGRYLVADVHVKGSNDTVDKKERR
ncbi:hypothetical protein X777_11691 [Ooceraea biroi]|uniref:Uncharacterized protein n=1 Tax=Ooceraea biroi TaxID=2015173 RepID=A0A026W1T6_OOCBI|nr:hypothetical protein X777_11691 [Ooceraea biroi]